MLNIHTYTLSMFIRVMIVLVFTDVLALNHIVVLLLFLLLLLFFGDKLFCTMFYVCVLGKMCMLLVVVI
jgi:hypothetical protein